jgi:hypothetical protein
MSTVTEVLASAMKSVDLINTVNAGSYDVEGMNQSEINDMIQRNVDHLGIVLAYEPTDEDDDTPNVVASSEDKTPYTDAIATGNTYIENNS